jgi:hypothetical protein
MRLLPFALLLSACASEPESVVEIGRVVYESQGPLIEAPASASVGESVVVRVTTAGGGCISLERTETAVAIDGAVVTPYDRRKIPGEEFDACTSDLVYLRHETSITFDTPGSKTISIRGRRLVMGVEESFEIPLTVSIQ